MPSDDRPPTVGERLARRWGQLEAHHALNDDLRLLAEWVDALLAHPPAPPSAEPAAGHTTHERIADDQKTHDQVARVLLDAAAQRELQLEARLHAAEAELDALMEQRRGELARLAESEVAVHAAEEALVGMREALRPLATAGGHSVPCLNQPIAAKCVCDFDALQNRAIEALTHPINSAAVARVQAEALEQAAEIAEAEPCFPGDPPEATIRITLEDPAKSLRAACGATKDCIAKKLRDRARRLRAGRRENSNVRP